MHPDAGNFILSLINGDRYDSIANLPAAIGSGYVRRFDLGSGLWLDICDCSFHESILIQAAAIDLSPGSRYSLIYNSSPKSIQLKHARDKNIALTELWNTIFLTGRPEAELLINAEAPVRFIYIGFTKEWLSAQNGGDVFFAGKEQSDGPASEPNFFFLETSSQLENEMCADLYRCGAEPVTNPLYLKSRVMTIVKEFITKVARRDFSLVPTFNHGYEISKIESRLTTSFGSTLPPVRELAREFCLSESTLKREFKKVYGVSISHYFMQKKMDHAFKLLSERSGNVSEIACVLGYEKVSRFITMFRKYKGVSPGDFLRSISATK